MRQILYLYKVTSEKTDACVCCVGMLEYVLNKHASRDNVYSPKSFAFNHKDASV